MAKKKPAEESQAPAGETPGAEGVEAAAQQPQQRQQVKIDDSEVIASYANFCRVTGTPEELIIDFGLNPQPMGIPTEPIPVTQRIITNFFTAKRMLHALGMSIQRHEATFGALELDVQKRVQGALRVCSCRACSRTLRSWVKLRNRTDELGEQPSRVEPP